MKNQFKNTYKRLSDDQKIAFDHLLKIGTEDFTEELLSLISSRIPLLYLLSYEDKRILDYFSLLSKVKSCDVFIWDCFKGLRDINSSNKKAATQDITDNDDILDYIVEQAETDEGKKGKIFLLFDYHRFIDPDLCSPETERRLKHLNLVNSAITTILVSPEYVSTSSLDNYLKVIDFPYASEEEILDELNDLIEGTRSLIPSLEDSIKDKKNEIVKSCSGMSLQDVSLAFSKSVVKEKGIYIPHILSVKKDSISKKGFLEFIKSDISFEHVGGLSPLCKWLKDRKFIFSNDMEKYKLDVPRGILLTGPAGTGKSLISKGIAKEWDLPLFLLEFGRLFGSLVGQTENNLKEAIKLIETQNAAILWLDEIEKSLSGSQSSGQTDGGTTSRAMQMWLTWMQEKTKPIFIVGTANSYTLPPELIRRFDEVWFVDNPSKIGRKQIFEIQFKQRNIDYSNMDFDILVKYSEGYNGDEIRKVVNETIINQFNKKLYYIDTDSVVETMKNFIPLSKLKADEINVLREWAKTNARIANEEDDLISNNKNKYLSIDT